VSRAVEFFARPGRYWLWFVVWLAIGCGAGLASLSIQLLLAPLAVVSVLVVRRGIAGTSPVGLLSGLGVTALIVAYIQRKGPGTVYWHTATASGADTYLDPRPWLIAGVVLVVAGVVTFALLERRAQDEPEQQPSGGAE
jgi:hypothetical protein